MTINSPDLSMIELSPDVRKATTWMLKQSRYIVRPGHDDGYGWHALLAAAFGNFAPKPFRLIERRGRSTQLLAYTTAAPAELTDHARTHADPAVYSALLVDMLAHKPMPQSFETGQRLGFEVRVRPTVRQDRDGDRRRSRERDAFLAAIDAEPRQRGARPEISREEVYRHWLAKRFGDGARLDLGTFRLQSLRRARLLRPKQASRDAAQAQCRDLVSVGSSGQSAKGEHGGSPVAVMQGELTVTDPARFQALLARGVGRHLSFGFGMLLLRPPVRR